MINTKKWLGMLIALVLTLMLSIAVAAVAEGTVGAVTLLVDNSAASDTATRADGAAYRTVQGAVAAAQDGDTIRLAGDSTATALITITSKRLTLDLNNYKLTTTTYTGGPLNSYIGILCNGTADLTVTDTSASKGGTLYLNKVFSPAPVGFFTADSARLTIERCIVDTSFTGTSANMTVAYNYSTGAFVFVQECTAPKGDLYTALGAYIGISKTMFKEASTRLRNVSSGSGANNADSSSATGGVGLCLSGDQTLTEDFNLGTLILLPPLGESLTLDLAGHNLTGDRALIHIPKDSSMTINNSGLSDDAHGNLVHNTTGSNNNTVFNQGALTLNQGVTVRNSSTSGTASLSNNTNVLAAVKCRGLNAIPTSVTVNSGARVLATGKNGVAIWDAFQASGPSNCTQGTITVNAGAWVESAAYCAIYGEYRCAIIINGGTIKSGASTPVQSGEGYLTVTGGDFITPLDDGISTSLCGVCAARWADNFAPPFLPTSQASLSSVNITARDTGIYLHKALYNGPLIFRNNTVNKNTNDVAAKVGITNLSGKDITITGKQSYYVCDQIYAAVADTVHGTETPVSPTGTLTITAGIYSVSPSAYVDPSKYAVLRLSEAPYRDLVAPWTKVGLDNKVSLSYGAGALPDAIAADKVDIDAIDDIEDIVSDPTMVESKQFTLSSSKDVYTAIPGLSVAAFENAAGRLTVRKTKAAVVPEHKAYVWYGGKSVGEIVLETTSEPTYDVNGDIQGAADEAPTAVLVRDGVYTPAVVSGVSPNWRYHANVPANKYNLIISAKVGGEPVTVTVLVTVNQDVRQDVKLPDGTYSSIVTFNGGDALSPNLEAGGLDDIAAKIGENASNAKVLIELRGVRNDHTPNAGDVNTRIAQDEGMILGVMMDMDLFKSVNSGSLEKITEVEYAEHGVDLITVIFHLPQELQGKNGYAIYRYHGAQVDKITETVNANGEYISVDAGRASITAYLNKFSSYAIAYYEPATSHTITAWADANGSISPSGAVVVANGGHQIFSFIPDQGYEIADVLVDGVSAGTIASYTFFNVTRDHSITVQYKVIPPPDTAFTVTFDSCGGSAVSALSGVRPGDQIAEPAAPTRPGYTFAGWFADMACTLPWVFTRDVVNADMTLYAGWMAAGDKPTASPAPSNPPTDCPKTGDSSNLLLWIILATASFLFGGAVLIIGKKKNVFKHPQK